MTNVVQFPANRKEHEEDQFFETLREDLDELFFVKTTKDGDVIIGHSPVSVDKLLMMYSTINEYIMSVLIGSLPTSANRIN